MNKTILTFKWMNMKWMGKLKKKVSINQGVKIMTTFIWWLGLIMIVFGGTFSVINVKGTTKFENALSLILMLGGVALVFYGNAGVSI